MTYRKDWMTDDQWECAEMFADVVGGFHHVNAEFKPHGSGIKVSSFSGKWATYDFDMLTKLVIYAHERMIRVELRPSGPRMVGFSLFKRHVREGAMHERHPTIDQAVNTYTGRAHEVVGVRAALDLERLSHMETQQAKARSERELATVRMELMGLKVWFQRAKSRGQDVPDALTTWKLDEWKNDG